MSILSLFELLIALPLLIVCLLLLFPGFVINQGENVCTRYYFSGTWSHGNDLSYRPAGTRLGAMSTSKKYFTNTLCDEKVLSVQIKPMIFFIPLSVRLLIYKIFSVLSTFKLPAAWRYLWCLIVANTCPFVRLNLPVLGFTSGVLAMILVFFLLFVMS